LKPSRAIRPVSGPALLRQISRKRVDLERIARRIGRNPGLVPEVIKGLSAEQADVKYRCAKVLRILSVQESEALYPYIETFISLLDSPNRILTWEGLHVIGNLAAVDRRARIDWTIAKYLSPISGAVMVSAANAVEGAAKIARAKPHLAQRIASEFLKAEDAEYQTPECRNVVLGHVIQAFDQFFELVEDREPVIALVRRQLRNPRNSTRRKAELFLKKHQSSQSRR
jgi:hypothetical protein